MSRTAFAEERYGEPVWAVPAPRQRKLHCRDCDHYRDEYGYCVIDMLLNGDGEIAGALVKATDEACDYFNADPKAVL